MANSDAPGGRPAESLRRRRELLDDVATARVGRRTHEQQAATVVQSLGSANAGAFSRAQALGEGITESTVRRMLDSGQWVRRGHGIYAERSLAQQCARDPLQDLRFRLGAVNVAATGLAAGSHFTAALISGVPFPRSVGYPLHILREVGLDHRAFPGAQLHVHAIDLRDLTVVDGLTVTTPARTALDIACLLPRAWAVAAIDFVLHNKLATLAELADAFERLPMQPGRSGAADALALADGRSASPNESLSRIMILDAGLPIPDLQGEFHDEDGLVGFTDFDWRDLGVLGEADGMLKYINRADLIAEKLREDRLRELGYEVVRWTWAEMTLHPERVVARIRRAMARAERRRAA